MQGYILKLQAFTVENFEDVEDCFTSSFRVVPKRIQGA